MSYGSTGGVDTCGKAAAGAAINGDEGGRLRRRHSAAVLLSSPDLLHGLRPENSGSRFWALRDDESSDEEASREDGDSYVSGESITDSEFMRDAVLAGYSVDEIRQAEALSTNAVSPSFGSVSCDADQVKHRRSLAQRIVDAVAERRPPAVKPWKGPLPKRRISPKLSLGDILVRDCRSKPGGNSSTETVVTDIGRSSFGWSGDGSPSAGEVTAANQGEQQFRQARATSRRGGPSSWPVVGLNPAHKTLRSSCRFNFADGLGRLFRNGGIPRDRSIYSPTSNNNTSAEFERRSREGSDPLDNTMFRGYGGGAGRGRRGGRDALHGRQRELLGGGGGGFDTGGGRSWGGSRAGFAPRRGRQGGDQFEQPGQFSGQPQGWRNRQMGWQEKKPMAPGGSGTAGKDTTDFEKGQHKSGSVGNTDSDRVMKEADGREEDIGLDQLTGTKCSRCTKRGHVAARCSAELYCVICDGQDHVNHKCPVLKQARPVAHAVGYAVHGLGFYHIPHSPLPRAKKESRSALITVVGGVLSKDQVITQLQRVFPGRWNWELAEHDENMFITKFPSKGDLQRADLTRRDLGRI
ncbi:hypothetical protein C2845_PM03G30090 [Panicum miliaceum]|uniref:CCHC-type domain-containing protein n=1 Tax=Panicum miliaceum TaxID=4540 RepID=A0A3L6TBK9_PANMI|nr:hypothetical protein C2845_PM03G30090 [Panicum miliaceum]